jgi:hypothetical protein
MIFINPFLLDFDSRECKQGFKYTFYHDSLQKPCLVNLFYFTIEHQSSTSLSPSQHFYISYDKFLARVGSCYILSSGS